MPGVLLWGYDNTNKVWIPLQVDTNGYVKVDLSNVNLNDLADVSVAAPTDGYVVYWDNGTSLWKCQKITGTNLSQTFGASSTRLANVIPTPISTNILAILNCSGSCFKGDIDDNAGAHGGQGLDATHVPYDGESEENMFNGLVAYNSYWGQIILHNTTKGESCKIVDVDRTNNVIEVTANSPDDVSAWDDNDVITTESQTNGGWGAYEFFDIDLSDNVATTDAAILFQVRFRNNTINANNANMLVVHPYETYDEGKRHFLKATAANQSVVNEMLVNIVSQKITMCVSASGEDDFEIYLAAVGRLEYADT